MILCAKVQASGEADMPEEIGSFTALEAEKTIDAVGELAKLGLAIRDMKESTMGKDWPAEIRIYSSGEFYIEGLRQPAHDHLSDLLLKAGLGALR